MTILNPVFPLTATKKIASVLAVVLTVGLMSFAVPQQAEAQSPAVANGVSVSVDGVSADISETRTTRGDVKSGFRFGFGNNDTSTGKAVGFTSVTPGTSKPFAFFAQGALETKTCGDGIAADQHWFRKAQVTISGLSISNTSSKVTVFWDSTIGPSGDPAVPQFRGQDSSRFTTANGTASAKDSLYGSQCNGGNLITARTGSDNIPMDAGNINLLQGASGTATRGQTLTLPSNTITSISFDVSVPVTRQSSTNTNSLDSYPGIANLNNFLNRLSLGVLFNNGDTTTISSGEDFGIDIDVNDPGFNPLRESVLKACADSPAASDPTCYISANTSFSTSENFNLQASFFEQTSAKSQINVQMKKATPSAGTQGYAITNGTVAKMQLSFPSTGFFGGSYFNFATYNYGKSFGQTRLNINPSSTDATTNKWDMTSANNRKIVTVAGTVQTSSEAISTSSWRSECAISGTPGNTSTTDSMCGSEAEIQGESVTVIDSNYARIKLVTDTSTVGQLNAGALVSTNAQAFDFGNRAGAFNFGVAGPHLNAAGAVRSDGFYYFCLPSAILATGFASTPTAAIAAETWKGFIDDANTSATRFTTGTCGTGDGLVGYLTSYGYSAHTMGAQPDTDLIAARTLRITNAAQAAADAAAAVAAAAARAAAVAQSQVELTTTVTTGKAPTTTQYAASDITGVTTKNVDSINKEVLALSAKDRADLTVVQKIVKKYTLVDSYAAGKPAALADLIDVGLLDKANPIRLTIATKLKKLPAESVDTLAKVQSAIAAEMATYNARKAKLEALKNRVR